MPITKYAVRFEATISGCVEVPETTPERALEIFNRIPRDTILLCFLDDKIKIDITKAAIDPDANCR